AAADVLGMSGPSVVRSLAALERAVGVRLLHRTTRRSSLSDEGREYYERCKRVLAQVEEADAALSARRVEPKGRLRLTAPVTYGRMHLAPVVAEFAAKHQGVEIELLLLDRVVDLVEEGIDAAVRIGHLPESTLVALPVGETRRVVCAAPAYLKRAGVPATPQDLAAHRTILFTGLTTTSEWAFGGKPPRRVTIRPFLRTNQIDAALDACLRGLGCAQFLSYQVNDLVAMGKLRRVLPEHEPPPMPIQLVYPHARLLSSNVRAFVDAALARLRAPRG
ncbi:MAG: LysR family transcriptional regulator, partial [Betaproteobacteria bacterium]|nr:LysR family transcriptional regulator [Betaproteobacteria bacterium]